MDAALAGLAGTTVGALAGIAGTWLAQRGQLRIQREQRTHEERVRWLDTKRELYRDLLIAMYGWHDALVCIWQHGTDEELFEIREAAQKWSVEANLIAPGSVRSAVNKTRNAFFAAQPEIFGRASTERGDPPILEVRKALVQLEGALHADLAEPMRSAIRHTSR